MKTSFFPFCKRTKLTTSRKAVAQVVDGCKLKKNGFPEFITESMKLTDHDKVRT